MPKGKKLTVSQMNLLSEYGIENPKDWLYLKTLTESDDGSSHANKGSTKTISIVVINKFTSETKAVPMN